MTALSRAFPLARVLRWLRGPWVADSPTPDLSWLDRKDGLDTRRDSAPKWADLYGIDPGFTDDWSVWPARYSQCDETCTADCGHCKGRRFGPYALPTRYDVQWPSVIAAEAPGGDLAAMAAPADWPPFSGWGEGYEIEPETRIGRHAWTPAEMRAMGDAIHDVVQAAHPPTPAVDEADVEALAGLMDDVEAAVMSATSLARRLLATGRVSVTK